MYCTKCGAKLREGAKFCHVCGKPVTSQKPADADGKTIKDMDINAAATPGEVSCKADAAQNAFMKLLKKGLLCILMLVGFSTSSQAESIFCGLEMDRKKDSEKGITMTVTGFENDVNIKGCRI